MILLRSRDHFIRGVLSPSVQLLLMNELPKTLELALSLAQKQEKRSKPRNVYTSDHSKHQSKVLTLKEEHEDHYIHIHLLLRENFTCCLTVKETTVIPGEHQAIFSLHADTKGVDIDGTSEKFACHHGLLIAHSISSTQRGSTLVQVLNPSLTPVTLRKGEKFVQFCSATSVEVEVLSIESNMILEIPKRKFSCEEADDTVRSLFKDLSGVMSSELIFWMFSC